MDLHQGSCGHSIAKTPKGYESGAGNEQAGRIGATGHADHGKGQKSHARYGSRLLTAAQVDDGTVVDADAGALRSPSNKRSLDLIVPLEWLRSDVGHLAQDFVVILGL